jgi:hypothetical protein
MVHDHKLKGFALFGTVAIAVTGLALTASAAPIPKDTVVTTYADNNASDQTLPQIITLNKDSDPTGFAFIDPNPGSDRAWLAPIGFGPDAHLYLAIASQNGQLLDLTQGGDLSASTIKPIAKGIFPVLPGKMAEMAFDAEGNVYLPLSETNDSSLVDQSYPIERVELKTGKVSQLKGSYSHARGLAIRPDANKNEILYIFEAGTGKILTYNLTTDAPGDKPLATGFPIILDHSMGQLAFDQNGKLILGQRMDPDDKYTVGIFDVTKGGDFSDFTKSPPLLAPTDFAADVNGLAFDSKNNMYIGGDNHVTFYSTFDASTGKWGDFSPYAPDNGGGDAETVAIAP